MAYYEGRINSGGVTAGQAKIFELLELNGWTKVWESIETRTLTTGRTWIYYQGPTVGSQKPPLLAFSTHINVSQSIYNIFVIPLIELDKQINDPTSQPFAGTATVGIQFPNDETPFDFRIACSGRRITGVFNFATRGFPFYLGFYVPYGTPDEFPYPMFCGGSTSVDATKMDSYSYTTTKYTGENRPYLKPYTNDTGGQNPQIGIANCVIYVGSQWMQGVMSDSTTSNLTLCLPQTDGVRPWSAVTDWRNWSQTAPTHAGVYPFLNIELYLSDNTPNMWGYQGAVHLRTAGGSAGVLDGIMFPCGRELTTDATCTLNGVRYIIGQQHEQVTPNSFFAIAKV